MFKKIFRFLGISSFFIIIVVGMLSLLYYAEFSHEENKAMEPINEYKVSYAKSKEVTSFENWTNKKEKPAVEEKKPVKKEVKVAKTENLKEITKRLEIKEANKSPVKKTEQKKQEEDEAELEVMGIKEAMKILLEAEREEAEKMVIIERDEFENKKIEEEYKNLIK